MANLFGGLEEFGFGKLSEMDVYGEEGGAKKQGAAEVAKPQTTEADVVFDKNVTCPVCDKEFKVKMVKTGKAKLLSADSDLRPRYQLVDSLKYDAMVCTHCGYGALSRFFTYMTAAQAKLIKEQISATFKGINQEGDIYTYDDALARHKIALVNTIVKKSKLSERAYTCLKISWLLRGKAENLPAETENYEEIKKALAAEELEFSRNAYEGFIAAFPKENFPMCGMDDMTTTYLVAELARRLGRYEESSRWVSRVLTSREANDRIKEKAREIKELIKNQL